MGMIVSARISDATTAVERVNESERKNCPTTPDSSPSGTKTTTVVRVELTTGVVNAESASLTAASEPSCMRR